LMWIFYVLRSEASRRYYIGHTCDLERRIREHNSGQTKSTRGRGPWKVAYTEAFAEKSDALARELQVKSWKSRRTIEQMIGAR
jgi:putative endonuclease